MFLFTRILIVHIASAYIGQHPTMTSLEKLNPAFASQNLSPLKKLVKKYQFQCPVNQYK
jgi:hypothetical protein